VLFLVRHCGWSLEGAAQHIRDAELFRDHAGAGLL
jgi:hypothetical protein